MTRSECDNHHSVHGEVGEAHKDEVVEVQELRDGPLETNHRVEKERVDDGLNSDIDHFDSHLKFPKIGPIIQLPKNRIFLLIPRSE